MPCEVREAEIMIHHPLHQAAGDLTIVKATGELRELRGERLTVHSVVARADKGFAPREHPDRLGRPLAHEDVAPLVFG
jgi:hypothetical protein